MAAITDQYRARHFTGLAKHSTELPAIPAKSPSSDAGPVDSQPVPAPAAPRAPKQTAVVDNHQPQATDVEPKQAEQTRLAPKAEAEKVPVVVVEDLHVKYKVFSSGKSAGKAGARGLLKRSTRGLKEVHALQGITFTAYKNESIGIIGSNGSGKSTLLRAITGLTPASQGGVWASSRPNLLGVGAALIPTLSGNDNITLGCLALGFSRPEIEELRPKIIEFAELEKFIDFPMKTYSSGMSARLKFAIAASKQHDILIVDEALAVGDARFRKRSEAKIREIRENAGTVFLVSHSMKSIRDTCNRAIWIEKGVQKMDGTTDEVIKAYEASRSPAKKPAAKK